MIVAGSALITWTLKVKVVAQKQKKRRFKNVSPQFASLFLKAWQRLIQKIKLPKNLSGTATGIGLVRGGAWKNQGVCVLFFSLSVL